LLFLKHPIEKSENAMTTYVPQSVWSVVLLLDFEQTLKRVPKTNKMWGWKCAMRVEIWRQLTLTL